MLLIEFLYTKEVDEVSIADRNLNVFLLGLVLSSPPRVLDSDLNSLGV